MKRGLTAVKLHGLSYRSGEFNKMADFLLFSSRWLSGYDVAAPSPIEVETPENLRKLRAQAS